VTGSYRINYETLGNAEPALHTHITPRFASEPAFLRRLPPALAYPKFLAPRFDPVRDVAFMDRMRQALINYGDNLPIAQLAPLATVPAQATRPS